MRNNEDRLGTNQLRQDSTPPQQLINQQVAPSQNLDATPLNFMVPTEHVSLPSLGRFYPAHHPLHNKDTIEIKHMTAKEEDILTSRNLLKKGVALDKLIQSLVIDKNINPDTLTVEDRNAIIIAARISAYGKDYVTQVVCPSCDQKVKASFDLYEKLQTLEEEAGEQCQVDSNGMFSLALPVSKFNVVCRVLNGMDEKELLRLSETKKNSSNGDSVLLDQLRCMVVSINNVQDKETIGRVISQLPAADSRYLRKQYQATVKTVDLRKTFNCSSCSYEAEMEVPLTADFFWVK